MMINLSLLFLCVILTTAEKNDGYCDLKEKTCDGAFLNEKFIMYDVNPPEGFNLRRDVYMRFAIMLSEAGQHHKNWKLILPPWYNLYHWKAKQNAYPLYWSHFFDVKSLKKFAPVVELHEVFSKIDSNIFTIDRLYVLQNFPDAFENGEFRDKWEIEGNCDYGSSFWGYKNITVKETICVKYQGRVSNLWELISLNPSDKFVMFAHGEIPLHDQYGTKKFWDCRRSMKFNKNLINIAKKFISKHFDCNNEKCTTYISIHWRRQDFARSCRKDVPSIKGTVKQIDNAIKTYNSQVVDIFIASDAQKSEIINLEKQLNDIGYKVHFYLPTQSQLNKYKDGGVAVIDQIICSHAAYFIGTHESTFTFRIQEEREILGFNSSTTFNRLCPDNGRCERPSKWKIVC
ncbi:GDP-fucose protein O-fucosyltransferase 2 [Nymphalis io]|uniref:GDP-fucose protein O-fucosyltransferase 2 n=1 Tax=Inachis io TaxID=171585 RepID=UPI002169FC49|nr:GDP-fucose protein O-fucosyltransferase 2 [Nymphalis io]